MIAATARQSEDPELEHAPTYREKVLKLATEKGRAFDPEEFRTDLFSSNDELEAFIAEI